MTTNRATFRTDTLVLNIGLDTADKRFDDTPSNLGDAMAAAEWSVRSTFALHNLLVRAHARGVTTRTPDREPTVVVEVLLDRHQSIESLRSLVYCLAEKRQQEAIAAVASAAGGRVCGFLAGPKAEAWGEFNAALMLMEWRGDGPMRWDGTYENPRPWTLAELLPVVAPNVELETL
jgi:hypothetical protein